MTLLRRWSSIEALELDSRRRGEDEVRTPLLNNRLERPLRSRLPSVAEINAYDVEQREHSERLLRLRTPSSLEANSEEVGEQRRLGTETWHTLPSPSEATSAPSTVQKTLRETPHHIFNHRQKLWMVYIVSFAGLFSPLSSNIYFPALGNIARVCRYLSLPLPTKDCHANSFIVEMGIDFPCSRHTSGSYHHNLHDLPRTRPLVLGIMG